MTQQDVYSQPLVEPHFTCQRLTDPVYKRLRLLSFGRLLTRHIKLSDGTAFVLTQTALFMYSFNLILCNLSIQASIKLSQ